jgi:thiamine-phosphate pyrophosphorylase
MTEKHRQLRGLYAITDSGLLPGDKLFYAVAEALQGGASIIQYRDKTGNRNDRFECAKQLQQLCHQHNRLFIINDDVDLAAQVQADGVHLGLDDQSILAARRALGDEAIIGATCHGSLDSAQKARQSGADYLAFGRFFLSRTKPDAPPADLTILRQAKAEMQLPIVAIGGIDLANAHIAIDQGADMIAVVHSLFTATDIKWTAAAFQSLFQARQQPYNMSLQG